MFLFARARRMTVATVGIIAVVGVTSLQHIKRDDNGASTTTASPFRPTLCQKSRKHGGLDSVVGNTPLIYMETLSRATGCHIFAKAEFMNPTGSVKDRAVLSILETAEANGTLKLGGTIVEGTGGNTGISLAQLGTSRGYKVVLSMGENVSKEKINYMKLFGAEVHVQPLVPLTDPRHFYNKAESLARENGGLFTNQFENLANYKAHYGGTGPEIWTQTERLVDVFVASAGTGGTLAGTSAFLQSVNPKIKSYLADPPGSALQAYVETGQLVSSPGVTITEGIGSNKITANFAQARLDGVVHVSNEESVAMAYYLMQHEGIYVGPSASLNVVAAVKLALSADYKGSGKTLVTILCDGGDRYTSKLYSKEWLKEMNLTSAANAGRRGDLTFVDTQS